MLKEETEEINPREDVRREGADNLIDKDQNRLKEDIVFSCMKDGKISSRNDSKDIKLFQGATIMGVVEKDYAGKTIKYLKILNTDLTSNSSDICFIGLINDKTLQYYNQKSFLENKHPIELSQNKHGHPFSRLLEF